VKKGYASPNNLEEANKLVNDCKVTRIIIIVIQLLISPIMYTLFLSQDMFFDTSKMMQKNICWKKEQPFGQPFPSWTLLALSSDDQDH